MNGPDSPEARARARLVKRWHEDPDWRCKALAVLRYRQDDPDLTEAEAGAKVGVGPPEANRMITAARLVGAMVPNTLVRNGSFSSKDLADAEERFFGGTKLRDILVQKLGGSLPRSVHILPYESDTFFRVAARLLLEILEGKEARTIGVNWGRMTSDVIQATRNVVTDSLRQQFKDRKLQCVPLSGDPVHHIHLQLQRLTASTLAAEFQEILTGDRPANMPCLTGVPAYIARRFRPNYSPSTVEIARQFTARQGAQNPLLGFIREIPGFRQIFGQDNDPALIDRLDTVITSVGVFPSQVSTDRVSAGVFLDERLRQEDGHPRLPRLTQEALAKAVIGDIGGWLLARPGANRNQVKLIDELNKGWIGLTAAGLKKVAYSTQDPKPGVIVLGMSAEKARMVLEAVRQHLASVLIIDQALADELQKLVAPLSTRRGRDTIA